MVPSYLPILIVATLWIVSSCYYSFLAWFKSETFEKMLERQRIRWPAPIIKHTFLHYIQQPRAGTFAMRIIGPIMILLGVAIDILVVLRIKGVIY